MNRFSKWPQTKCTIEKFRQPFLGNVDVQNPAAHILPDGTFLLVVSGEEPKRKKGDLHPDCDGFRPDADDRARGVPFAAESR